MPPQLLPAAPTRHASATRDPRTSHLLDGPYTVSEGVGPQPRVRHRAAFGHSLRCEPAASTKRIVAPRFFMPKDSMELAAANPHEVGQMDQIHMSRMSPLSRG